MDGWGREEAGVFVDVVAERTGTAVGTWERVGGYVFGGNELVR